MKTTIKIFTCPSRALNLGTYFINSFTSVQFFSSTTDSSDNITPIKFYANTDTMRLNILMENKNKAGIHPPKVGYINGKSYIGSSVNLYKRFQTHYSIDYLMRTRYKNTKINRAFFKYGYSNFSLHILEYCDVSVLIEREQYYLDLFNPEYNINPTAGNSLGFKHSSESKKKMSAAKNGKILSQNTKKKISTAMTGKIYSQSTKDKISQANGSTIFVYSLGNHLLYTFPSLRLAAKYLNCSHPTIIKYVRSGEIFQDKYILSLEELPSRQ
jgi:group I intron endonuclease